MGFEWRSEWSAFRVALVHETAKRYADWYGQMQGQDFNRWEEYDSSSRLKLTNEIAEVFLAADEAKIVLLRSGLSPVFAEDQPQTNGHAVKEPTHSESSLLQGQPHENTVDVNFTG